MNPTVSVLIRTHGRRALVLETIRSAVEQTRPPDEIIVAVDGDVDDSADAIRRQFPDVVLSIGPNRGRAMAFNRALSLATSEFVALSDDDDYFLPHKVERVRDFLRGNIDCRAVNHPLWKVQFPGGPHDLYGPADFSADDLGEAVRLARTAVAVSDWSHLKIKGESFTRLLGANCGAFSGSIIERRLLTECGGMDPSHAYGDDWSMFLNVARVAEWWTLDERLGIIGHHPGRPQANLGPMILATKVNAWLAGRPYPEHLDAIESRQRLSAYGVTYRAETRQLVWSALKRGDYADARTSWHLGCALLPRWRDRLGLAVPPRLSARFDRLLP